MTTNKCFILTRCDAITEQEKQLINNSNIFKMAVNYAHYNSNCRLFHDYSFWNKYVGYFSESLITSYHIKHSEDLQQAKDTGRFILFYETSTMPVIEKIDTLHFDSSSIIPAINYCTLQGFTEILLIADNTAYDNILQQDINKAIAKYKDIANIYQYSNGNFILPIKTIEEFIRCQ